MNRAWPGTLAWVLGGAGWAFSVLGIMTIGIAWALRARLRRP